MSHNDISYKRLKTNIDSYSKTHNSSFQDNKLVFEKRKNNIVFYCLMLLTGLFLLSIPLFNLDDFFKKMKSLPHFIFGLLVSFFAIYGLRKHREVKIFDHDKGHYFKSDTKSKKTKLLCLIDKINGIQLLEKKIFSNGRNHTAYEVNLVLQDKSRLNVLNYCDKESIQQQAQELSEFLGVRLWSMLNEESK